MKKFQMVGVALLLMLMSVMFFPQADANADSGFAGQPRIEVTDWYDLPFTYPDYTYDNCWYECYIIVWGDFTFWTFSSSYEDATVIGAYDQSGELISSRLYQGDYEIEYISIEEGFVYLYGYYSLKYDDDPIRIPVEELRDIVESGSKTTLTISADQIKVGEEVVLTASVTGFKTGIFPTGTITFESRETHIGEAELEADGTATLVTSTLPVGRLDIVARYSGDEFYSSSQSDIVMLTVLKKPNPGEPHVRYDGSEAPVSIPDWGPFCFDGPSWNSNFSDCPVLYWGDYEFWAYEDYESEYWVLIVALWDGEVVGTREYVDYSYGYTRYLYDITIGYDSNWEEEAATFWGQSNYSLTIPLSELAEIAKMTTTTLVASDDAIELGESVTLKASVTGVADELTGDVQLIETANKLTPQTKPVGADGTVVWTLNDLPAGEYSFRAVYQGDADNSPSRSGSIQVEVIASTFTVEFYADGELVDSQTVEHGAKATKPEDPEKEGYTFVGWYDAATDEQWDFDGDVVTGDLELYAKWEINRYKVRFVDEEANELADAQTVEHGAKATKPEDPEKEGYTFVGWYDAATGEHWDFDGDVVTGDLELYAKWEINPPEAPVLGKPEAGNAQVRLTWSASERATSYIIYVSDDEDSYGVVVGTVGGDVLEYVVPDLTNGNVYYFTIVASNDGGDSPFSNTVSAKPITVPSAPYDIEVVAGDGKVTISFKGSDDDGGSPITEYVVTDLEGNVLATGESSPIEVTGLMNGETYQFVVYAVNEAGDGEPSQPSEEVVPTAPAPGGGGGDDGGDDPSDGDDRGDDPSDDDDRGDDPSDGDDRGDDPSDDDDRGDDPSDGDDRGDDPSDDDDKGDDPSDDDDKGDDPSDGDDRGDDPSDDDDKGDDPSDDDDRGDDPSDGDDRGDDPSDDDDRGDDPSDDDDKGDDPSDGDDRGDNPSGGDNNGDDPTGGDSGTLAPDDVDESERIEVDFSLNGQTVQVGVARLVNVDHQQIITIVVDPDKLQEALDTDETSITISMSVLTPADVVIGTLSGQMVKDMEDKDTVLQLHTSNASYSLPVRELDIEELAGQFGTDVSLQDIEIKVEIAAPSAEQLQMLDRLIQDQDHVILAPPIQFHVRAVYGDQEIEITQFETYIERTIRIPDGVDPDKITTAVVIEPDGTLRHVPTKVMIVNGQAVAIINSLTNSTYALIWNPVRFDDVAGHWAEEAINDMGSRKIVNGVGEQAYAPNQAITRAEFAAMIVRALGLRTVSEGAAFLDVQSADWYSETIRTAYAYNLINGYPDGTFRPMDLITREQAMVILSKAMVLTGLKDKLDSASAEEVFGIYQDADQVSAWARQGVADTVNAGIIVGRSHQELAPQASITRAEAAVILQRLLQHSDLI